MASNPWWESLESGVSKALLSRCTPLLLRNAEMLYRVGDPTGTFYGLQSGKIKISSLGQDGHEAILTVLEAGNWFGEMSMVDRLARTHDATALGDCHLLAVSQRAFDELMDHAGFAQGIARLLASRMRLLFSVLEDSSLRSVRARAARRLLLLSHGDSTLAGNARRTVPLSQDRFAMMLGVTRQTLGKELNFMAEAGAIKMGYGVITLVSIDKLKRFAD